MDIKFEKFTRDEPVTYYKIDGVEVSAMWLGELLDALESGPAKIYDVDELVAVLEGAAVIRTSYFRSGGRSAYEMGDKFYEFRECIHTAWRLVSRH